MVLTFLETKKGWKKITHRRCWDQRGARSPRSHPSGVHPISLHRPPLQPCSVKSGVCPPPRSEVMATERPSERGRAAGGPGPGVQTSSLAPRSASASLMISLESASSCWTQHSLPSIKYSSRKTPNSNAAFRVSRALGMEAKNRQKAEELLTTGGGEGRRAERPLGHRRAGCAEHMCTWGDRPCHTGGPQVSARAGWS